MKKLIAYLLIYLHVFSSLAFATEYWVRPLNGDYGDEDGTSYANAFDGWADLLATATLNAGDHIYICGDHAEKMITPDGRNGTAESPIIFDGACYNGSTPDPGTNNVAGADSMNFSITGENYWTIQNISFSGGTFSNMAITASAASGGTTHHITIDNVTFLAPGGAPSLYISSNDAAATIHDITVQNSAFGDGTAYGSSKKGIWVIPYGQIYNIKISGNTIQGYGNGIQFYQPTSSEARITAGLRPYGIDINGNNFYTNVLTAIIIQTGLRSDTAQSYVRNNYAYDNGSSTGQYINDFQFMWLDGVQITGNTIDTYDALKCDGDGIILDWAYKNGEKYSENLIVSGNTIRNILGTSCDSAFTYGIAISAYRVKNSMISYNVMYNNEVAAWQDSGWTATQSGDDPTAPPDDIFSSADATPYPGGQAFTTDAFIGETLYNLTDGSSCEIADNDAQTITCVAGGLTGGDDNSFDDGDSVIIDSWLTSGVTWYNNVMYGSSLEGIYVRQYAPTTTIKNNIIANNNQGIDDDSLNDPIFQYNILSGNTPSQYAGFTLDATNKTSAPLFINPEIGDFHIQIESPAIDSGVDVGLASDFDGVPIPQGSGVDIGAYEKHHINRIKGLEPLDDGPVKVWSTNSN